MLSASQSFKLYAIVQRYFNKEEDAQAFVGEIETVIDKKYDSEKDRLATKEDLLKLQMEMRVDVKRSQSRHDKMDVRILGWSNCRNNSVYNALFKKVEELLSNTHGKINCNNIKQVS